MEPDSLWRAKCLLASEDAEVGDPSGSSLDPFNEMCVACRLLRVPAPGTVCAIRKFGVDRRAIGRGKRVVERRTGFARGSLPAHGPQRLGVVTLTLLINTVVMLGHPISGVDAANAECLGLSVDQDGVVAAREVVSVHARTVGFLPNHRGHEVISAEQL